MARPSSKALILDVAERLFAEQGIDNVSIRTINDETGLSHAALHYHFKNKEALVKAILLRSELTYDDIEKYKLQILKGELACNAETVAMAWLYTAKVRFIGDGIHGEYFLKICSELFVHKRQVAATYLPDSFLLMQRNSMQVMNKLFPTANETWVRHNYNFIVTLILQSLASFRNVIVDGLTEAELLQEKEIYINELQQFITRALLTRTPTLKD